ncbi:unnamed protein product, partial [Didymodactylos carnosus]
ALTSIVSETYSSKANPRLDILLKQVRAVAGHIMGSDHSRAQLRIEIHSLVYKRGLPSIFITINLADIHSPTAMYFAGVNMDIDEILLNNFPSTVRKRAQLIASHPVTTAKFFNHLIQTVIDTMISGEGVLGPTKAYYGTVESSGRGSLHLHMLIWLDHEYTPADLKQRIKDEEFRKNLIEYLEDIIKDLDQFQSVIEMRRNHPWINNFSEWLMTAIRCNMDIKYIWSASDAKALVYYIRDYVTKSSLSFYDTYSLMLKGLKSIENSDIRTTDVQERSRRLVLRCYNTIASQQELSGPLVASYFMGWPDHYINEKFVKLFLIGIECHLQLCLDELKSKNNLQLILAKVKIDDAGNKVDIEKEEEQFILERTNDKNTFALANTRIDYQCRPITIENVCLYDFVSEYYRERMKPKHREYSKQAHQESPPSAGRGRPRSERLTLTSDHPLHLSHLLMKRAKNILIPRKVEDLCSVNQTWDEAFRLYEDRFSDSAQTIIDNIELLHECKENRDAHLLQIMEQGESEGDIDLNFVPKRKLRANDDSDADDVELLELLQSFDSEDKDTSTIVTSESYIKEAIEWMSKTNRFEYLQRASGMGNSSKTITNFTQRLSHIAKANDNHTRLNKRWKADIKKQKQDVRRAFLERKVDNTENQTHKLKNDNKKQVIAIKISELRQDDDNDDYNRLIAHIPSVTCFKMAFPTKNQVSTQFNLNAEQHLAFMIIARHLDGESHLKQGEEQEQLLMCIPGTGGTGKSHLIQAITTYFKLTNREQALRKLAPTAVAFSNIDDQTIHSFLVPIQSVHESVRPGDNKVEREWQDVEYVFIDEMSMVHISI